MSHCSELQSAFMDILEAPPGPHHLLRPRSPFSCSFLLGSPNFLSLCKCRCVSLQNAFRCTLCVGNHNAFRTYPVMSTRKGNSIATFEGLREIVWTVEADLAEGQLLYITGEPVVLGCWKPEMAILMSPIKHSNLWKAKVKIACGVNCKYNYFIKEENGPFCDVVWRPGPAFSLSVPVTAKQDGKIVVRDSWMTTERSPPHIWGPWMEDTYFPLQPLISAPGGDEYETLKLFINGLFESKLSPNDLVIKENYFDNADRDHATHKDELVKLFVDSLLQSIPSPNDHEIKDKDSNNENTDHATHKGSDSGIMISERDQPVEEPWFVPSSCSFTVSKDGIDSDASENSDNDVQRDSRNQPYQVTEKLLPKQGSKDSISTIILINSSVCTMQRIAILEDEKLVELLLEPVKSTVQCGSVYLGRVVKFVPNMGGAFVNIGNTKSCLMEINEKYEPFIFPPFSGTKKKKELNGSVPRLLKGHPAGDDNERIPEDDVEVIEDNTEVDSQNFPAQLVDEDCEELEVEDDFAVPEVVKENTNSDIMDYADVDADFENDLDGIEHHVEGESVTVPVKTEHSYYSHLQSMMDSWRSSIGENKWDQVRKGTKIIVQVVKEGLGTKGPTVTPFPKLSSRFWILSTRGNIIGVSKKISGDERTRLKAIAKILKPPGFGLTVRTAAVGHPSEELQKDLLGLLSTWENIVQDSKSAALAADEGVEGAVPVILHRAMGQTLSVVQDYFNEKVKRMVIDSERTYHEVTNYLQEIAPDLRDRVELHNKRIPLFDQFNIEEEINNILSKKVPLANGGSLVIEQTEALVSIDVNGGHGMCSGVTSQEKAVLQVNLAAAKRIARELRLRNMGGIIVVDFIDMEDELNKRLVYEEVKKAIERDRSVVQISELSRHGLMEITRKRVRPSVTYMISEPCTCCHATGRVEALETSFSKIEQEIRRFLAKMKKEVDPLKPKTWPRFTLEVDKDMRNYLTSGKKTKLAILRGALKVWILLKEARSFTRGAFELKPVTNEKVKKEQPVKNVALLPVKKKAIKK